MKELRAGWRLTTVGEAGRLDLGRQRHPDWHQGPEMRPYLRVANVFEDRIDTSDVKEMDFSRVFERFRLSAGDVLLNEGQTPELLGRPAIYRGVPPDVAFTNTLIRFRPHDDVLPEWALAVFRHYMHSGRFKKESRITTNIAHLSLTRLKSVEFPVPPLAEQRRIVEILEDHLSRLGAATDGLRLARARLQALSASTVERLRQIVSDPGQPICLGDLALDARYGTSTKCVADGPGAAVVRIPNLVDGRIDLSDEKRVIDASIDVSSAMLQEGDLLVVRTNGSRALIGRTAVVQPGISAAFASYLIRYRVDASRVRPEWVHLMMHSPSTRAGLESMAASSAGQYNLSLEKLDRVEIALPSLDEQDRLLAHARQVDEASGQLRKELVTAEERSAILRRSLLAAAFSGRLTGCVADDEIVEELAGV